MFILARLTDTIRVLQTRPGRNLRACIADEINIKYSNRVVNDLGLCISVRAIDSIGSPRFYTGSGGMFIKVVFRVIVFRPVKDEVILCRVMHEDETGIMASVGFFDHIFIPKAKLPNPSQFDKKDRLWVWAFEDEKFHIEIDGEIRVRVESIKFNDPKPGAQAAEQTATSVGGEVKGGAAGSGTVGGAASGAAEAKKTLSISEVQAPMLICATMNDDGLGPVDWWPEGDGGDDGD